MPFDCVRLVPKMFCVRLIEINEFDEQFLVRIFKASAVEYPSLEFPARKVVNFECLNDSDDDNNIIYSLEIDCTAFLQDREQQHRQIILRNCNELPVQIIQKFRSSGQHSQRFFHGYRRCRMDTQNVRQNFNLLNHRRRSQQHLCDERIVKRVNELIESNEECCDTGAKCFEDETVEFVLEIDGIA